MNIFEMYDAYRKQHATEFKALLNGVAKELLSMSENIPEEIVWETFKKDEGRQYLLFVEDNIEYPELKEGFLLCGFSGANEYQFRFDDNAAKKLDKFLETYYPGIVCYRNYELDLYNKTVSFQFGFKIKFEEKDFDKKGYLNNQEKNIDSIIKLFNDDIAELLQCKFNKDNWDSLITYKTKPLYEYGLVNIAFPID